MSSTLTRLLSPLQWCSVLTWLSSVLSPVAVVFGWGVCGGAEPAACRGRRLGRLGRLGWLQPYVWYRCTELHETLRPAGTRQRGKVLRGRATPVPHLCHRGEWAPVPHLCHRGEWAPVPHLCHRGEWAPAPLLCHRGEWAPAPLLCHRGEWAPLPHLCHRGEWAPVPHLCHWGEWAPVPHLCHRGEWAPVPHLCHRGEWAPVPHLCHRGEWAPVPHLCHRGEWAPVPHLCHRGEWKLITATDCRIITADWCRGVAIYFFLRRPNMYLILYGTHSTEQMPHQASINWPFLEIIYSNCFAVGDCHPTDEFVLLSGHKSTGLIFAGSI